MKKKKLFLIILILLGLVSCKNSASKMNFETEVNELSENDTLPLKPSIEELPIDEKEHLIYKEAYDLWYNNKPQEAISLYLKFIKQYPNSSLADDAQRMIGTAYRSLENYPKAIEAYENVKIKYPDSNSLPGSLYDLAHLYFFSINDFTKAKYYYEETINSATIDDKRIRDMTLEILKNWEKQIERYTGSAERSKIYKHNEQKNNPTKYLSLKGHSWYKGGFETIGIHDFSIVNSGNVTFKDIVVRFDYYAESGTFLGRSLRTVYKQIPPKQSIKVEELNTGFIPIDANSCTIHIVTAIP